jgi:RNA polymerase subunit RPABC4/transcription elongation factor Spt4
VNKVNTQILVEKHLEPCPSCGSRFLYVNDGIDESNWSVVVVSSCYRCGYVGATPEKDGTPVSESKFLGEK